MLTSFLSFADTFYLGVEDSFQTPFNTINTYKHLFYFRFSKLKHCHYVHVNYFKSLFRSMIPNQTQLYEHCELRAGTLASWRLFPALPAGHFTGGIYREAHFRSPYCVTRPQMAGAGVDLSLKMEDPLFLPNSFSESFSNANLTA